MRYPTFSSTEIKASAYQWKTKKTVGDVVQILTENLKSQGFIVILHMDVAESLKNSIGISFRKYELLEVWSPKLSYQAILFESHMGLTTTIKILIQEHENGEVEVSTVNPMDTNLESSNPGIETIKQEIGNSLNHAISMIR